MNFDCLKKTTILMSGENPVETSDGPIAVTSGTRAHMTIALDPGNNDVQDADWCIHVWTPSGYYSYVAAEGWKPVIIIMNSILGDNPAIE